MTDSVIVNNNRCVSPFKPLSPFSLASSTWQSRWTSSDRLTTSTQKCTSSSTCRPESWSRATTNLFWTTGQPSRRSKGETFITSFLLKTFFFFGFFLCFCFFTNFVFTGFYFFLCRLTETVELLQMQVEELQHQVEELKLSPFPPQKPSHRESWPRSTHSVSCLQELQNTLRWVTRKHKLSQTSGA